MKNNNIDGFDVNFKQKLNAHNKKGLACVFTDDGSLLATCSADKTVKIWKLSDMTLHSELIDPKKRWVWNCAFTADSKYLFTVSSDIFPLLWHVEKKQVLRRYMGHQSTVTSMDFCDEVF
ncbi:hypothetical protein HZS_4371 [Henneguya salminicola]|nr:hypothetical protein HZS_4371 [Henneguya salminicola]